MKKPVLITYLKKSPSKKMIAFYASLPYHQTIVFYTNAETPAPEVINTKAKVVPYPVTGKTQLPKVIKKIIDTYPDRRVLPYFAGDNMSKYAINCYNQNYGTKVNARIFKDKDLMAKFFAEFFPEKKTTRINGANIIQTEYTKLKESFGGSFVIKPTNASSSFNAFFIKNEADFANATNSLKKRSEYVVESFITGRLYALDGFFDGKNFYVLSYSKETPFCELFDHGYFKKETETTIKLKQHYAFMLPVRYNLHEKKLNKHEWEFIQKLREKLSSIEYRGFLHIEYKYDKSTKEIGFIEWGARLGGFRKHYIKELRHTYVEKIPYEILHLADGGKFLKVKKGIYFSRDEQHDMNIIGFHVPVFEKTHTLSILKRNTKYLSRSLEDHIRIHLQKEGIEPEKIQFWLLSDKDNFFHPFYQRAGTRLAYFIWLSNSDLHALTHKKKALLERLILLDFRYPRPSEQLIEE